MIIATHLADKTESNKVFESQTLDKAKADVMWPSWFAAFNDDTQSLLTNITWTLVSHPINRRIHWGNQLFKFKKKANGEIVRYKTRWLVHSFEQQYGLDYQKTFASVINSMSFIAIFATASDPDLELEQINARTTFSHGNINENVYVERPISQEHMLNLVYSLNNAVYWLKQLLHIWLSTPVFFLKSWDLLLCQLTLRYLFKKRFIFQFTLMTSSWLAFSCLRFW